MSPTFRRAARVPKQFFMAEHGLWAKIADTAATTFRRAVRVQKHHFLLVRGVLKELLKIKKKLTHDYQRMGNI